ncbi:PREDICTED: coiled-coil domain-containing protein 103 [Dufourea novaeangliae]|uniref:coiled-coil domain-containing protein 103 n=1 Tax=Dufourea novaeangliae TaxID=178035 RepID=UPI0007678331|nr:PREDICTED: coiled-coil domain-containing protein 103 [Dufourea novaeangliae]
MDKISKNSSKLTTPIDYKSLQMDLEEAVRTDETYKLQNDAKLRAVEQNVPTYEDFRQMVNAAHLRPLKRDDFQRNGSWNTFVCVRNPHWTPAHEQFDVQRSEAKNSEDLQTNKLPSNCEQFIRAWKKIDEYDAKFRYLQSLKNVLGDTIFHTEIPSTLFAELIDVCLQTTKVTNDIDSVVEILRVLSKCNRFQLTLHFMGDSERKTCMQLFQSLIIHAEHRDKQLIEAIESLGITYGIAQHDLKHPQI